MEDTQSLIDKVDALKVLLEDAAIAQQHTDDEAYTSLKTELLSVERIRPLLPRFLKFRPSLQSFRQLSQQQYDPGKTHSSYATRRKFIEQSFNGVLEFLYEELSNVDSIPVVEAPSHVNSDLILKAWRKALDRMKSDPEGAITSARSLLETVCKHILDENGDQILNKNADLGDLYNATIRTMELAPDQQSEKEMRQMLQGCLNVVLGIGALRNRIGDAHGKNALSGEVETHHAFLGVSIACTVAHFLIVSWENHSALDQEDAPESSVPTFVENVIAVFGGQLLTDDDNYVPTGIYSTSNNAK